MKYFLLLLGISTVQLLKAQNRITIKKVDEKTAAAACSFNGEAIDCGDMDTKVDIQMIFDPQLPNAPTIAVTDKAGKAVPSHVGNAKAITGADDFPTYVITITFPGFTPLVIADVGANRKDAPDQALAAGGSDADCACTHDKAMPLDHNTDITNALDLCPNCGDDNFFVYDAQCKLLFKKDPKSNTYSPVTNAKDITFKYRESFKIKVIHANRYLKDVVIAAEDLSYKSEAPPLFDDFFGATSQLAGKLMQQIAAFGGGVEGTSNDSLTKKDSVLASAKEQFEAKLVAFYTTINQLKETRDRIFSLCCEATANCGEQKTKASFTELSIALYDLQVSYTKLLNALKKKVAERDVIKADLAKVAEATKVKGAKQAALKSKKDELDAKLTTFDPDLDDQKSELEAEWAAFEKPTELQIRNLVLFSKNYLKQSYTYSTPPIYPQGNRMTIKLNIDSKDTFAEYKEGILTTDHQALEIEGPVLNKWFFAFSSGPFLAFNGALYETNYEFQKIPGSGNQIDEASKYTLTAAGKSNPPIGLSALAHFENKRTENFGVGLSIGVGLTAETKPRIAYLAGGSLFFGDENQFALTGGVAAMQIDVLQKDLYPQGLVYKSIEPLKFYKDLRMGGFVSLTYTLFTPHNKSKQPTVTAPSTDPAKK